MSSSRKFPHTRRVEYRIEQESDEVDSDFSQFVPGHRKPYDVFDNLDGNRYVNELSVSHLAYTRQEDVQNTNDSDDNPEEQGIIQIAHRRERDGTLDSNNTSNSTEKYDGNIDKVSGKLLTCCCGDKCWKTADSFNTKKQPFLFRGVDLIAAVCSILFFFYDVISDVALAEEYFRLGRWISFGFTTAFVVAPLLVMNAISVSWYHRDYIRQRNKNREDKTKRNNVDWIFRVFFSIPMMCGSVVRQIEYIYHGWKSRSANVSEEERYYHYKQMLFEDADAGMLKMFEAFLEAAPQLVLQMFIILTETSDDGDFMKIVRQAAMFGSWIGASWSLVAYQKALRASHNKAESGLSFLGTIFYYLWRACEVGPRLIVLALCAAQFEYFMLIGVAVHWIAMSIWISFQKQEMNETKRDKIVFDIVIGYVLIFCFQNVQEGQTRYRALFYYCITFTENLVMLATWVHYTPHTGDWYYIAAISVVPTGMVLHIILQLLYYKCFHPNHHNIKFCAKPGCFE